MQKLDTFLKFKLNKHYFFIKMIIKTCLKKNYTTKNIFCFVVVFFSKKTKHIVYIGISKSSVQIYLPKHIYYEMENIKHILFSLG